MTETDNQIMNELENTVHQNWKDYSLNWTDKVSWSVNNNKELLVDNFIQSNVFHYVEDQFLTDEVVKELET